MNKVHKTGEAVILTDHCHPSCVASCALQGSEPDSECLPCGVHAGVVENVLGQVLDAFQSRLTGLMGRCACRGLADNPQLAALMAKEPSALQVRP